MIETNSIVYGGTNTLRSRLEGDVAGMEYAKAILALLSDARKTELGCLIVARLQLSLRCAAP